MEAPAATQIVTDGLVESFRADRLNVHIYDMRSKMGSAAALAVATEIRRLIAERGRAVGIFASAPSQNAARSGPRSSSAASAAGTTCFGNGRPARRYQ